MVMLNVGAPLRVVFAAAEAAPIARVGGLAEASAGLIRSLRSTDEVELVVVLPDYGDVVLEDEVEYGLALPDWASPAGVRKGVVPELGEVHLVSVPGMARPHPYVDEWGTGWPDNDVRFFSFSAAIAAIVDRENPDLVHLNDWHTAMALAWVDKPAVYTVHTLGYQGHADIGWLRAIDTDRATVYDRYGAVNPAAGAIVLADRVVAVSPNYAHEILDPARSAGLHTVLEAKGDALVGIRNGIDTSLWDPLSDPFLLKNYGRSTLDAKATSADALRHRVGWSDDDRPIIGMVTRLVEQKGLDIVLGLVPYLDRMGARLVLLGSGEERLSLWARDLAVQHADNFAFIEGYDLACAHEIFAGSDLLCMPSRFEPCGLAQMQAMAYGTIPVVTPVGGLVDTVIDDDVSPGSGTGFVALTIDIPGILDALHRALAAWRQKSRRRAIQKRGMAFDWSWDSPRDEHLKLYRDVLDI
jgi:starch synthase